MLNRKERRAARKTRNKAPRPQPSTAIERSTIMAMFFLNQEEMAMMDGGMAPSYDQFRANVEIPAVFDYIARLPLELRTRAREFSNEHMHILVEHMESKRVIDGLPAFDVDSYRFRDDEYRTPFTADEYKTFFGLDGLQHRH